MSEVFSFRERKSTGIVDQKPKRKVENLFGQVSSNKSTWTLSTNPGRLPAGSPTNQPLIRKEKDHSPNLHFLGHGTQPLIFEGVCI